MQGPVKTGPFAVQVTAAGACMRGALVSVVPGRSSRNYASREPSAVVPGRERRATAKSGNPYPCFRNLREPTRITSISSSDVSRPNSLSTEF